MKVSKLEFAIVQAKTKIIWNKPVAPATSSLVYGGADHGTEWASFTPKPYDIVEAPGDLI